MTPMCKFLVAILANGQVCVYETFTATVSSVISTNSIGNLGVWAGYKDPQDEFKLEGKLDLPCSGSESKLYQLLTGDYEHVRGP